MYDPKKQILVGALLVTVGFALPVMMVMDIIEASLFLSFLAHGASVVGLILGLIGTASIVRYRKR